LFASAHVDDAQTCQQIASTWNNCGYLLDPHSAIGVKAALESGLASHIPVVTLATAHPAKFPQAIQSAGLSEEPRLPSHLSDLFERPERFEVLDNELSTVHAFMADNINA